MCQPFFTGNRRVEKSIDNRNFFCHNLNISVLHNFAPCFLYILSFHLLILSELRHFTNVISPTVSKKGHKSPLVLYISAAVYYYDVRNRTWMIAYYSKDTHPLSAILPEHTDLIGPTHGQTSAGLCHSQKGALDNY